MSQPDDHVSHCSGRLPSPFCKPIADRIPSIEASMRQDRRRFCRTALGMMALGVVASTPALLPRWRDSLHDLAALFRHPDSARRIGKHLLARGTAALDRSAPLHLDLAAMDGREARRSALRQQAMQDYAAGNVVLVDGWVLSRTEAQLCALVALT
jgi:hypothetical protein